MNGVPMRNAVEAVPWGRPGGLWRTALTKGCDGCVSPHSQSPVLKPLFSASSELRQGLFPLDGA